MTFRLITMTDELGGAETQAVAQARLLMDMGVDAEVAAIIEMRGHSSALAELCAEANIAFRVLSPGTESRRRTRDMRKAITELAKRSKRGDAVVGLTYIPNLLAATAGKVARCPSVWQQRDLGLVSLSADFDRVAIRLPDFLVANSASAAQYVQARGGRDITVLTNLQSPHENRTPKSTRTLQSDDSGVHAISVANFGEPKDHALLIHAWNLASAAFKNDGMTHTLTLVGRVGETFAGCQALIRSLGLSDSVHIDSNCTSPFDRYPTSTMYVCSSRTESHSNSIDEAMWRGLPVIGPSIPAVLSQLPQSNRDFIFAPRTAEALACRIIAVASDREGGAAAGAANHREVAQRYAMAELAWRDFYAEVIAKTMR